MSVILREYLSLSYDKSIIKEARETNKPILVKALLQRADEINQNKRLYPKNILEREVRNFSKAVAEGRAGGELDHPESSVVSLQNVSHVIREIWWEGNNVMGTVELLNTPKGKIAQDLMEAGIKLGISSRAIGDTVKNENGVDVVDENLYLLTFDLVSEPSTMDAWLVRECKEIDINTFRRLIPKCDRINRIVNEILKEGK